MCHNLKKNNSGAKGLNELEVPSLPRQRNFVSELSGSQFSYMFLHFSKANLTLNAIEMYKCIKATYALI